ncbi:hypothetical protein AGMMS50255_2800 [Spirochaetia bacterium]|nr:hypothetical protein AGMMS50255_2800 [Spirochaetia bacterium]
MLPLNSRQSRRRYNSKKAHVSEFAIDFGPGYRIYFIQNTKVIVLLLGGDKSSQDEDIVTAKNMAEDIKGRLKK